MKRFFQIKKGGKMCNFSQLCNYEKSNTFPGIVFKLNNSDIGGPTLECPIRSLILTHLDPKTRVRLIVLSLTWISLGVNFVPRTLWFSKIFEFENRKVGFFVLLVKCNPKNSFWSESASQNLDDVVFSASANTKFHRKWRHLEFF